MATSSLERDLGEPTPVADSLGDVFYRLRSRGAYTRLEPDDGKLSRPVLRGGSGSNAVPLPDPVGVGGGGPQGQSQGGGYSPIDRTNARTRFWGPRRHEQINLDESEELLSRLIFYSYLVPHAEKNA